MITQHFPRISDCHGTGRALGWLTACILLGAGLLWAAAAAAQTAAHDATLLDRPDAFPADLSGLNHRPAGAPGRVRAEGEALVFGDGSPARFWGVNIQANALFRTDDTDIAAHAAGLARMGVNLVRLHHHDSIWVRPNIFGTDAKSTGALDSDAMARIDTWIAALKAEGIYIWLDLHVGRHLGAEDRVAFGQELRDSRHKGDLRGYNFVNPDIAALMARTAQAYLSHVNPMTGLSYAEDPAIAVVQLSNENDLVKHFTNRLLPGKGTPGHAGLFADAARDFAAAHGLEADDLLSGRPGYGSALLAADLEHRFFTRMTQAVRKTGYDGLVATSSFWGGMPLAGLASLSKGDLVDVHSYARPGEMRGLPQARSTMLSRIASAHVAGRPLSVSEWNMGWGEDKTPAADRHMTPVRMAAMAAYQSWDALMLYGYAQRPLTGAARPGPWHAATDPGVMAALPIGALLFRAGHLRPAETTYLYAPDAGRFFDGTLAAETAPLLRHLPARAGLRVQLPQVSQLPWLTPGPPPNLPDDVPARLTRPAPRDQTRSDTRELFYGPEAGVFRIDTPQSKVLAGGLENAALPGLIVKVTGGDGVLVAAQSLGTAPLVEADRILVSLIAPSWPQRDAGARPALPFAAAPLTAKLRLSAPAGLRLDKVVPARARTQVAMRPLPGGGYELDIAGAPGALWLTLARPQ